MVHVSLATQLASVLAAKTVPSRPSPDTAAAMSLVFRLGARQRWACPRDLWCHLLLAGPSSPGTGGEESQIRGDAGCAVTGGGRGGAAKGVPRNEETALTLGETTLISSFKNRNFPTSLWNLRPQFFMHASSTCSHRRGSVGVLPDAASYR